jgi:hypothetical protein
MTDLAPSPRVLYVHDDLSEQIAAGGETSPAGRLGRALFACLRQDPERVVVLTLAQQLDAVVASGDHPPFALTIGIGDAGVRVAAQLHARAGWFPRVHRVEVWREEDGRGGYVLAGPTGVDAQLADLPGAPSVAVVDDTVFSGLTIQSVLGALPRQLLSRTHVFCLRAVADTLAGVARQAPVTAGFAAPGRILEDVSFINASGLVRRGAIRRVGRPPLAFFERPEWIQAWFPGCHHEVIALCRQLSAELEQAAEQGPPASLAPSAERST